MVMKLQKLKQKIEKNLPELKKKHPISPLIAESIDILIDMRATDEEMHSWMNIQKKFIRDIEKEIMIIEKHEVLEEVV